MASRTELLTTAGSLEELIRYKEAGADAFVIGESRYGSRLPGEFNIQAMAEAVHIAKQGDRPARIYAAVNNLMDNDAANSLDSYLQALAECGVDAIVFGDPSVLMAVRALGLDIKLHWNAEMTSTNYTTANYWGRRGANRVVLARELNLEEILEVKANTDLEVQVQVHGITTMYHSKRSLVDNYAGQLSGQEDLVGVEALQDAGATRGMYVTEGERPGQRYPIYQDEYGTYMMSPDDICMLENLHELLETGIDSLRIEGLMKSPAYNEAAIRAYRTAIDAYESDPEAYEFQEEWLEPIQTLQDKTRELSFGFFYKEQVY